MKIRQHITVFEWDQGNRGKNWFRHGVADEECEEVFLDPGKRILKDRLHSGNELRFILIGKTKRQKLLYVAFTIRQGAIRVISARDLKRKERSLYEEET